MVKQREFQWFRCNDGCLSRGGDMAYQKEVYLCYKQKFDTNSERLNSSREITNTCCLIYSLQLTMDNVVLGVL